MSQLLNFRMKLFSLREDLQLKIMVAESTFHETAAEQERVMQPRMIGNMLASMLCARRDQHLLWVEAVGSA